MEKLKQAFQWFVYSSANGSKIALTLKAGIPFLVLLGVSDSATLEQLVGSIGIFLALIAQALAGAITMYGLVRKIWRTVEQ